MLEALKNKLSDEAEALLHELNVTLPDDIERAVAQGDLRENSEYKAALERQQFVQARLGQLTHRMQQLSQLATTEAPRDRVGLGSTVRVVDLETDEQETYVLVLSEMMDFDAGHISLQSPLGLALRDRQVGDEVKLRLPTIVRKLKVVEIITIHDAEA